MAILMREGLTSKQGVYFLANNHVLDWAIAFLNSLRYFNPDIPLWLIPFDQKYDKIVKLQRSYNFNIFEDSQVLKCCDDACNQFMNSCDISFELRKIFTGMFRRFISWWGPLDRFIYIDIDTILFKKIDFILELVPQYDFLSASGGDVKQVWNDDIYASGILTEKQIKYACNSGFFVSHKLAFSQDYVNAMLKEAAKICDLMNKYTLDQAFLNYMVIKSDKKYCSIYELFPEYVCSWAGIKSYHFTKESWNAHPNNDQLIFMHWAGYHNLFELPYRKIWEHYRFLNPVDSSLGFFNRGRFKYVIKLSSWLFIKSWKNFLNSIKAFKARVFSMLIH